MAKSIKELLMTPVDTDMSLEGFKRAFGIKKTFPQAKKEADMRKRQTDEMSKRITEKSYEGKNVAPSAKPKSVKVSKKEVEVSPMPEGLRGSIDRTSDVIGPDMGAVNREAPVRDLSTQASPADIARISGDDRSTWVDPHEQARRMMGFGTGMKKGGSVKAKKKSSGYGMKSGGSVKSKASSRADGCAVRGKTKGRLV